MILNLFIECGSGSGNSNSGVSSSFRVFLVVVGEGTHIELFVEIKGCDTTGFGFGILGRIGKYQREVYQRGRI